MLFNDFSALAIQHALMSSFGDAFLLVLEHLLSVDNFVATTDCAMCFGLIHVVAFLVIGLLVKVSFGQWSSLIEAPMHLRHHFFGSIEYISSKAGPSVEEWVIFERITHHFHKRTTAKSLHHLFVHAIHSLDHVAPVLLHVIMYLLNGPVKRRNCKTSLVRYLSCGLTCHSTVLTLSRALIGNCSFVVVWLQH